MALNDQLTLLSFHVDRFSHSWNKAISNFDLENLHKNDFRCYSLCIKWGSTVSSGVPVDVSNENRLVVLNKNLCMAKSIFMSIVIHYVIPLGCDFRSKTDKTAKDKHMHIAYCVVFYAFVILHRWNVLMRELQDMLWLYNNTNNPTSLN